MDLAAVTQPDPVITLDGGLVLRAYDPEADLPEFFRVIEESLAHLRPWMPWVADHSLARTRDFLAGRAALWASGEERSYAIVLDGAVVGSCGLARYDDTPGDTLEIGYWLHTGSAGLALEVGHLTVNPEGRPCHCGSRGCLDVETDPLAFLTAAGRAPGPEVSLLQQARDLLRTSPQDPGVRVAVGELIDRLGLGLAGLVNILNPDRIILGGLHRELLDADPERLRAVVADRSLWGRSGGVPILPCTLDHNSLVGAAELAWQPVLDDPLAALTREPV